jgi:hypothetical protein
LALVVTAPAPPRHVPQDDGIRNWPPMWLTYETPWDAYFEACLASMMKVQEARKVDSVVVEMQALAEMKRDIRAAEDNRETVMAAERARVLARAMETGASVLRSSRVVRGGRQLLLLLWRQHVPVWLCGCVHTRSVRAPSCIAPPSQLRNDAIARGEASLAALRYGVPTSKDLPGDKWAYFVLEITPASRARAWGAGASSSSSSSSSSSTIMRVLAHFTSLHAY